ncbi:NADP-dependent oxidoreductase domain protein [Thermoclostridium stercorarium subsp. stercorarium DSM 8532]|jgi:predicted aldo/keto reductase-like oxidoreductase|uniref:NADP-dependent oxidoreductase domain protein n=2 Tax=Thermoclostridium stercorarium TaxID=1510 RepID=L7VMX5_THES1|nr:aldo/keto reductase [Thermoclostridium stercorarium]AGC68014.1 NADP-dependent oxidoreductase domain protein [Thermoclostridium stercorarium subsp. stercorarium DSM 8532]AGI39048.1 oxidoreductase [Thermoclostridium stercorarium subsp. stercorarium DSM 8532]ANW98413.1 aldo/keto reductase [Thermoclostridium stercorarium subsp. thermolacticum DSM 2910]UZQ86555.1 aldo/keto reductase [Thermoclostridium stercorarium]
MEYRKFSKFEKPVSLFGIGCMRLPTVTKENKTVIDEDEAIRMIRYGIDQGVNYIDTAYGYHDGQSEIVVGKALADGYREKVYLATKLPVWLAKEYSDFERLLNEQLKKLNTDHVDFYLLHALNKDRWETVNKLNVFDFLEKARASGKIRYICFSFHDDYNTFRKIIDAYDWDMCQIQLNIMDMHEQATVEGLKYAGSKGIPVVIMEPLKGGKLASSVTPDIEAVWNKSTVKRTPVEWAFRWLYNFPEIAVILSGVSNMEQLKDNLRIFSDAKANSMTEEELALVEEVRNLYLSKTKVPCTNCKYCMPCPQGVSIPRIFNIVNNAAMYNEWNEGRGGYRELIEKKNDATQCIECGQCESACPQSIPVIQKLKEAHQLLVNV